MKLALTLSLAVTLTMSASGCNKPPVARISHPPTVDLTCPSEPDINAMLEQDPTGLAFDVAVRAAGQSCRDALARVCRWHKERGAEVSCPRP